MASRVICTEKLCETGVKEENNFFYIIYDRLLAFISEKFSIV